jgi:hypothetical protein
MKKLLPVLFFVFNSILLYAKPLNMFVDLTVGSSYNSNVLKLSDTDISSFKNENDTDKFKINTVDDLVVSAKAVTGIKHTEFFGHTQVAKITLKYDKYISNELKDEAAIGIDTRRFFSRKVNLYLGYFYYPHIYLNRYRSVLDDAYHDFTYAKNVYTGKLTWKVHTKLNLNYKCEFSQSYYDECFTEYDADNLEHALGLTYLVSKKVSIGTRYSYKVSTADGEDAFENPAEIDVIKDASYEANIYNLSFTFPRLLYINKLPVDFSASTRFEQRYFQSENAEDEYHLGRNDEIWQVKGSMEYPLSDKWKLMGSTRFEKRVTDSPYSDVETEKEYDLYEMGLSIIISL